MRRWNPTSFYSFLCQVPHTKQADFSLPHTFLYFIISEMMTNNKPSFFISLLPRVFCYSNSQLTHKLSWLLYNGTQRQSQGYFSKHSMTNGNWIHKLFILSKNKRKLEIKAILKDIVYLHAYYLFKAQTCPKIDGYKSTWMNTYTSKWGSRNISWTWEIIIYCKPLEKTLQVIISVL